MQAHERPPQRYVVRRQVSEPLPLLGDDAVIVAMAAGFLILHILVGVMLLSRPSELPNPAQEDSPQKNPVQETMPSPYD